MCNYETSSTAPKQISLLIVQQQQHHQQQQHYSHNSQQQQPQQHPFQPGDALTILEGPFTSLNAVFQQPDGESRSTILLNFLGQQLHLTIENKSLEKNS